MTESRATVSHGAEPDKSFAPVAKAAVLLSEAAVITAMLYYFGWVRTQAVFGYFGIDVSLLSLSVADYALRSVNVAFPPLIGLSIVVLLLNGIHRRLVHALADGRTWVSVRGVEIGMAWTARVCAVLLGIAALGLVAPEAIGRRLGIGLQLALPANSLPRRSRTISTHAQTSCSSLRNG